MDASLLTEAFFQGASELEGTARAEYVERLRRIDPELCRAVAALLEARGDSTEPPDRPPLLSPHGSAPGSALRVGTRLGPYEIRAMIAAGGMGVVYRAARVDGAFEKEVAVKLVETGAFGPLGRRELLLRFLAERRILAALEHPYVARLLDGGTAPDGSPFLVMELVDGEQIDRYCERRELSLRARVALFARVCEAVQYAHERFIAHRDLKPGNVLVAELGDGAPLPKVLDFGIARIFAEDGAGPEGEQTVGLQRFTPAYASPEQFLGRPVTAASDVYSLGVLLYRLLAGELPYELAGLATHEVARRVCEEEPRRPSSLDRRLRGELETILLKALAKEPERRYASAGALAGDLERWMEGRPLLARPATRAYLLRKAIGRHRLAFALGAGIFLTLAGSTAWISLLFRKARAAERTAEERWRESEHTTELVRSIFAQADPFARAGREPTVREAIERFAPGVIDSLADQPGIRGRIRHMLATTYDGLGQLDEAREHALSALEDLERSRGPRALDTLRARLDLASILLARNELPPARRELERILADAAGDDPALRTIALRARYLAAVLLREEGDLAGAEEALERLTAAIELEPSLPTLTRLDAWSVLGLVLMDQHKHGPARAALQRAIALQTEALGREHPWTLESRMRLAALETRAGGPEGARAAAADLEEVVRELRSALGPDHRVLLNAVTELGGAYFQAGDHELAEAHLRDALAAQEEVLGLEHRDTLKTMNDLAGTLWRAGRLDEAETLLRETLLHRARISEPTHVETLITLDNLVALLRRTGRPTEALDLLAPLAESSRDVLDASDLGRSLLRIHDEINSGPSPSR